MQTSVAMNANVQQVFECEYVKLRAKLADGRTLDWTHWVPNKEVDAFFGVADVAASDYPTADEYADERARGYTKGGIYALWEGSEEELIPSSKIIELTTAIEKSSLSVAQIMMREAELHDKRTQIRVRPRRKRPDIHEIMDVMDRFMKGSATLNDFLVKIRQPECPAPDANTFLRATAQGYARVEDGSPVNLHSLVCEEMVFQIMEIRRTQILQGLG
jgi:hypothetical protein